MSSTVFATEPIGAVLDPPTDVLDPIALEPAGPAPSDGGSSDGSSSDGGPSDSGPEGRSLLAGDAPGWAGRGLLELAVLALCGVLCVLVPVLAWNDTDLPGRALFAALFVFVVPGAPLAILMRLPDGRVTATLAVGLSMSTTLLSGAISVTAGWWAPTNAVILAAAVAVLAMPWAVDAAAAQRLRAAGRPATWGVDDLIARYAGLGVVVAALVLWWRATVSLNASSAGATGLVGIAPVSYWLCLALLAGVLGWALLRPQLDHLVIGAATLALALCAYLLVNVSDGVAGVGAGWVHVGFIDYVSRTGEMATGIDARFSWPGFLAGSAQLVSVAGLDDSAPLMLAAPLVYFAAAMTPIWLIGRLVTGSPRLAWVTVLIMLVFNWYQQDYFSGQATGFVLYVSVLAVMLWAFYSAQLPPVRGIADLRWLRAMQRIPGRPNSLTRSVPAPVCVLLEVALIVMTAALIVSHQLTPIPLLVAMLWFVIAGATRWRTLWLVGGAMFIGWFSYGATDYWIGNLQTVFQDVGNIGESVGGGTAGRVFGDPVYQRMQLVRIAWTALLGALALIGLWHIRRRRGAFLVAGLSVIPFSVVVAQSYGGEVIIRCALYAGPILAPLAAVALGRMATVRLARLRALPSQAAAPTPSRRAGVALSRIVLAQVLFLAFAGLTMTRGLNVSFEHVTRPQVQAARVLLDAVPDGSWIGTAGSVGPLPLARIGDVNMESLINGSCVDPLADCLRDSIGTNGASGPDYVYITDGQDALGALQGGQPRGWTRDLVEVLMSSGGYRAIVNTDDVVLLERTVPFVPRADA